VNSRELRRVVDEAIDTVRFFRGAMFNMVSEKENIHIFDTPIIHVKSEQ
jgi:hypothetical protein